MDRKNVSEIRQVLDMDRKNVSEIRQVLDMGRKKRIRDKAGA